jgi:TPR repeat protein
MAAAQDFVAGLPAFYSGDYATALREWTPLAEQGDALAQVILGLMYNNGEGVPQDHAEALRWYRLAAAQGYAEAQVDLGLMHDLGRGVPQDDAEALRWYRLAAAQGNAKAQLTTSSPRRCDTVT